MLGFVEPKAGEVFYDLGCGSGQPLMIAALAFPQLAACKGIELLESLASLGKEANSKLERLSHEQNVPCAPISVIHGDIFKDDWSDADIIFVASVCFSAELMEMFSDACSRLKKGTRILFMNTLPTGRPYLKEVASWRGYFTWGLHMTKFYMTI